MWGEYLRNKRKACAGHAAIRSRALLIAAGFDYKPSAMRFEAAESN
jgi:hypothetical protein